MTIQQMRSATTTLSDATRRLRHEPSAIGLSSWPDALSRNRRRPATGELKTAASLTQFGSLIFFF